MSWLCLLAALVLPAQAGRTGRSEKKDTPVEVVEEAPYTDEERAEVFQAFTDAITKSDEGAALEALADIVEDPEKEAFHGMAYASMGALLRKREYPYGALAVWAKAIELDPDNSGQVVKPALEVADEIGDTAFLEQVFAANVGLDVDAAERARLAYLAARGAYAKGSLATTLAVLSLIPKDDPNFGKAQSLKGVALSRQGKYTEAMAALLAAQQLLKDDPEQLDIVNLNLARTYYAAENYLKSIEFYAKVSRESHWWPEAQFERAWAHFRVSDVNGALGILHTHVTPFYKGWYFPEAQLLRGYSLFLICKFPEASEQIDSFQADWTPVRDELEDKIRPMSKQDVFEDARRFLEDRDHSLPEMVLRDLPYDERFKSSVASVDAAQKELDRLQGDPNDWSQIAFNLVLDRRKALILGEGGRIKTKIEAQADELTGMLNDTEIAKLDMLKLETRLYEQASVSGEMPDIERVASRKERVRKGYVAWPYEGEFWADEVGYYRVEAKPECPEGLMTGAK